MVVKHEYFVGYQYVDTDFKIKNSALLSMFEDLACIHGACAGEDIRSAPTVWLLTAYKVKVLKRPEYAERVTASTWSRGMRGVFAFREFEIRNSSGELLVCALSEWAHVFKADGKPARVTPELEEMYESEPEHSNFGGERIKICRSAEIGEHTFSFSALHNLMDVNRHMNNVHYIEQAELALPEELLPKLSEFGFEIYYRKEIKYGDRINCFYAADEGSHNVFIRSENGETLHAQVKFIK